jgi:hypothetical protein
MYKHVWEINNLLTELIIWTNVVLTKDKETVVLWFLASDEDHY